MKISEESLTIRLPGELKINIAQFAAELDIGFSELGRLALELFLNSPAAAERRAKTLQDRKSNRSKPR